MRIGLPGPTAGPGGAAGNGAGNGAGNFADSLKTKTNKELNDMLNDPSLSAADKDKVRTELKSREGRNGNNTLETMGEIDAAGTGTLLNNPPPDPTAINGGINPARIT